MIKKLMLTLKKSYKPHLVMLSLASLTAVHVTASSSDAPLTTSKGFLQPRPSSGNIAREMLMEQSAKHKQTDNWYGQFSGTAFYERVWNQNSEFNALGAFPFWSGTNQMSVGNNTQSSTTLPLSLANVDAYQFGLGPVDPGTTAAGITLDPMVYQAGLDLMFIIGSSSLRSGFYAKAKVPLAIYNINYNLTEQNPATAVAYSPGALSQSGFAVNDPAISMTQAFTGFKNEQQFASGDYTPMNFGLINNISTTLIKFGDVELTVGYNYISRNDNSFTIGARASAPTGNKATGVYMLEPIVGRGGNYGMGGYTAGHVHLWEGQDNNMLTFKIMADVMHLFETKTMRSYDLISAGQGSRYLLVANYAGGQYQFEIQNLINYTTLTSNSSFGIEGDVAAGLSYASHGWSFDAGYEFYGRSAEILEITGNFNNQTYAILGRQGVALSTDGSTPSTLCQPTATIGSSVPREDSAIGVVVNAVNPNNRIAISDLNIPAAQQAAYKTSKVFTKVAFEWEDTDYLPFIGVIGEFEWSQSSNNALPQWSLALVGGTSF